MKIQKAEFSKSSAKIGQCPETKWPEYAFIGRSNVGKSSLINMLMDHKGLAKTSSRPGKTQLINHFNVNDQWWLVDLPGYGYAKVSKKAKEKFQLLIVDYMEKRENLTNVFVLIDSRHEPQKIDLEFMEWLGELGVPFSMVFTKIDKLTGNKLNANLKDYRKKMLERWEEVPVSFATSAETGAGKQELLGYMGEINRQLGIAE
ncbi:MAG TPA: YihA family ribosome biogenesis GTP-binding protein [Cryomorphaceae bacterium]|nr:YihA family ribosome biogenesis GTP-binding protein [Cryomorphaceae bacterium]